MRLSEYLKTRDIDNEAPVKRPLPKPVRPSMSEEPHKETHRSPEVSRQDFENQIRGRLEKEYQEKLEKMEDVARQQIDKVRKEMQPPPVVQPKISREDLERDIRQKLEAEYQQKLEKSEEAARRRIEPAIQAPALPVSKPAAVRYEEVVETTASKGEERRTGADKAQAAAQEAFAIDPKVRQIVTLLLHAGDVIMDQAVNAAKLDISILSKALDGVIDSLPDKDSDFIRASLEPYPNPDYFVYHAANCAMLALVLGLDFRLSREEHHDLGTAAFLHDIGLVNISESLDYPLHLPAEVQNEILMHPERSTEILKPYVNPAILTAVRQHHEANNGKGYPYALKGEEIHPYAGIIHAVDSFEALTHERPYRKRPMTTHEAMKEMIEKKRGVYDPSVLKSMMGRIGLYPVLSLVELSNKQIARVIRQNHDASLSPVVKVEFDEWGNKAKEAVLANLKESHLVHIVGAVADTPSFSKEKTEQHTKAAVKRINPWQEILPAILIVMVLSLLIYAVLKI